MADPFPAKGGDNVLGEAGDRRSRKAHQARDFAVAREVGSDLDVAPDSIPKVRHILVPHRFITRSP